MGFLDSTAQLPLFSHSVILLFCQNYVFPWEDWSAAADAAFDKVFSACNTSQSRSPYQLLIQMLKVPGPSTFIDSKFCVNERNCGISKGLLLEYITQRLVPSDHALVPVSIQPESSTQAIVNLTQLCTEEAEVLFVYQPVAEDTADTVILVIEQERVTMVEDPFSESAAQHKRYVAAVRVPRHRWLYYEYDTGELISLRTHQTR